MHHNPHSHHGRRTISTWELNSFITFSQSQSQSQSQHLVSPHLLPQAQLQLQPVSEAPSLSYGSLFSPQNTVSPRLFP
jgi:hypothetical protein